MTQGHEFICNPTVRVLRWNERLLNFSSILMFRIHETIQHVKYDDQGILSLITHNTMVTNSIPIPFEGCFSDPSNFIKVVREALDSLKLFQPHNNEILSGRIPQYFYCCYNSDYTPDPSTHKIVIVVEIFRKTVNLADQTTGESNEDQLAAALKLHAEQISDQYLHDEEDYSRLALIGILGNLIRKLTARGYQLSTRGKIDELVQVKAAIKLLPFNGRRCDEDECPICYEEFCEELHLARMPCSHIFHKHCVFTWLLNQDSCPRCRSVCKTPII